MRGTTRNRQPRIVQVRRIYEIVRRLRGRRYRYPRLSLEGGALAVLGLEAGQAVEIEYRKGEIRIRPFRRCAAPRCRRAAGVGRFCSLHRRRR
jgi:hypothetical protein